MVRIEGAESQRKQTGRETVHFGAAEWLGLIGLIVSVVFAAVAVLGTWFDMRSEVKSQSAVLIRMERTLDDHSRMLREHDGRLRRVERQ